MSSWALFDASDRLVGQCETDGTAAPTMARIGFARPVRTARQADLSIERIDPVSGAITEDPAKVGPMLIDQIKVEAERRKMMTATPGGWKKTEYAAKRAEVAYWDSLGGTVTAILAAVEAMPAALRAVKFEYAAASAAAFGEPNIAKAITRFRSGIAGSAPASRIAATEERATTRIRAATSAADQRAIVKSIDWNSAG